MADLSITELHTPPDDFLRDEPEGAAFHKAFLAADIDGFECAYLAIFRDGRRISVVPYFLSSFSADTLLHEGILKKLLSRIKFRYACVGHPSTDFGLIDGEISAEVLALVNATLAKKCQLLAYKGFPANLPLEGYSRARGLPVPVLTLKGDYYSGLDARRRNDFRHKLGNAQTLRVEASTALPEQLIPQVYQLYLNTYNRASLKFEKLTPSYFHETVALSKFLLFFEADVMIGFVQIIGKNTKAALKYIGMDYLHNRQYGLYYVMCLKAIEVCLHDGYRQLELGVTSYHFKHLLGGQQTETSVYFRHNNRYVNWLLSRFKFLLEPGRGDLE